MTRALFQCSLSLRTQRIHWPIRLPRYAQERALSSAGRRRQLLSTFTHNNIQIKYYYVFYDPNTFLSKQTCTEKLASSLKKMSIIFWSVPLSCRYDILVGRSPGMGNATKLSYQSHISLVQDLKPGDSKNIFSCDHVQHSLGFTVLITVVLGSGILRMAVTSG